MQSLLRLILVFLFAATPLLGVAQASEPGRVPVQAQHKEVSQQHPCPDHHGNGVGEAMGISCDLTAGHCAAATIPQRDLADLHRTPLPAHLALTPVSVLRPATPEMETPPPRS